MTSYEGDCHVLDEINDFGCDRGFKYNAGDWIGSNQNKDFAANAKASYKTLEPVTIDIDIQVPTSKATQDDLIAMMNRWLSEESPDAVEAYRQFETVFSDSHLKIQEYLVG